MSFHNFCSPLQQVFTAAVAAICITVAAPQQASAETAQVMFSYQGRVKVSGQPFGGTGQFKFAIINTSGTATLWSNDGTSDQGGQPTGSIQLPVEDGVFNVLMGDPQIGMNPINPTIFQSQTPLRLRVWFNDGTNGFQQLNPDHKLINLTLTTIQTGNEDFTIYVNSATGNDAENGLTPETAKKTIQAAIDTLPDRIRCNVTVDIADGIYPESVRIFGMSVEPGKKLKLVGDETWTAASTNSPAVQVTGQDSSASNAPKVRTTGFHIVQSYGVNLTGLEVEGYTAGAVHMESAIAEIIGCRLANSEHGLHTVAGSYVAVRFSKVDSNFRNGFYLSRQASAQVQDCKAINNGEAGFRGNGQTTINFVGNSISSGNSIGAYAQHHSSFVFAGPLTLSQNSSYGLCLSLESYTENDRINIVTGNGNSNLPYLQGGSNRYNF